MSHEQFLAAQEAIRAYGEWAEANPEEARQALIDSGILAPGGGLSPAYGGPGGDKPA